MDYEDTYFESFAEALAEAQQQNIIEPYSKLQLCFYDGDEIQTSYKNLIYLPINNISNKLLKLNLRPPTQIKLTNGEIVLLNKEYVKNLKRCIRPISKTNSKFAQNIIKHIKLYENDKIKDYK